MMEVIKKLTKLIDVKSLVTLGLIFVLCIMTLRQLPTNELFNSSVMLVLGFFFGKKVSNEKKEGE